MTPAASRFLALHTRHFVVRWQWLLGESMLRATADSGATATISKYEWLDLQARGLAEPIGCAGVRLTEQGRAAA